MVPFSGEGFAQRAHDRNRTGDGGLVIEVAFGGFGCGIQFAAGLGEQRLVGGNHGRAVGECGQDQFAGGLDATDHFDHHV